MSTLEFFRQLDLSDRFVEFRKSLLQDPYFSNLPFRDQQLEIDSIFIGLYESQQEDCESQQEDCDRQQEHYESQSDDDCSESDSDNYNSEDWEDDAANWIARYTDNYDSEDWEDDATRYNNAHLDAVYESRDGS